MTDRRSGWEPASNPYEDLLAERDRTAAGGAIMTAPANPDAAGRANALARQMGVPADTVLRNLAEFEQQARARGAISDVHGSDYLTRWYANPGNAAAASDDSATLRAISDHLTGLWGSHPYTVETAGERARRMEIGAHDQAFWHKLDPATRAQMADIQQSTGFFSSIGAFLNKGIASTEGGLDRLEGSISATLGLTSHAKAVNLLARQHEAIGSAEAGSETPWAAVKAKPSLGNIASFGAQQTVQAVPSIFTAVYGFPLLVGSMLGQGGEARAQNNGREDATTADVLKAAPFSVAAAYLDRFGLGRAWGATGGNIAIRAAKGLAVEAGTQAGQAGLQYTGGAVGTDTGFSASEAFDQTVSGGLSGVFLGGAIRGAHEARAMIGRDARMLAEANQAAAGSQIMDTLMASAEGSKLRGRDPEAFRQFIDGQTQGTAVENIYIPAEAVRELNQNYHEDPFFADYARQIDEALLTQGDVVLPTADVAARLAGTPAWEALASEARFSPGGMSKAELESLQASHGENLERVAARISEEMQRAATEAEPAQRVYQQVRDALTNAGIAPDAANHYAQVWAAHREQMGARMGMDAAAYHEANPVEFRRVLPETLAKVQASDNLDLVIHAMKGEKSPLTDRQKFGPSLLEWIAARGGVHDRSTVEGGSKGGDIAAMGGDKWHKQVRFRPKLIKATEAGQGDMLGGGGGSKHSQDVTFQDAIDAGYFPELAGSTEALDSNHLLDAIGRELGGDPVYSHDRAREDHDATVRQAAVELRGILENRGIDPDKATKAQIKQALDTHREEALNTGDLRELEQGAKTEAFKRWFGESKVVDAAGKPLVVYHGTNQPVEQFSAARRGMSTGENAGAGHAFFFTSDPAEAHAYAENAGNRVASDIDTFEAKQTELQQKVDRLEAVARRTGDWDAYEAAMIEWENHDIGATREDALVGQNIVPAFLSIQNPKTVDFGSKSISGAGDFDAMIAAAKAEGHDGLILKNIADSPKGGIVSDHYAVFEPEQVKSPHNSGAFDAADPRILFQENDGARGVMKSAPGRVPIIELFAKADLSTVIHESAHVWLEEFSANAALDHAPADVKADWETVKAWFAENGHPVGDDGFIPTEAHELWARGFERYTMEGKAPSSALRAAFQSFKGWLLQIYKHVANLNAPISPEIRDVFDRMLATEDAINEERARQDIKLSFDRAQLNMTDAEYGALKQAASEARSEASDALLYKTMATIRRQKTQAWKDEETTVRADLTETMHAKPEFRALELLRSGKWLGEPDREPMDVKLDREWLVRTYGSDALGLMPRGTYGERGTDPDTLAEMLGFRSGDDMVRALMGLEGTAKEMRAAGDKRTVLKRMIEEQTAATMTERHGDPLNDGSIEEEALAAIHNDNQGEVIAAEARALARQRGNMPTPYKVAREWAEQKISDGKVADVASRSAIQRYARAAAKAARAAEAAAVDKDIDEAFRQKQAQLLNHALLAEAKKAADDVDAIVARLGKIAKTATRKSIDQEYLDRAHALLEGFDFRTRSQSSIDAQEAFNDWAVKARESGIDVTVPPRYDNGTNYSRVSVSELRALDDAVKQQIHLGRYKQDLIDAKNARDFGEARGEVMTSITSLPKLDIEPNIETWGSKAKHVLLGVHASMTKMGRMIDVLDAGNPNGPLNRYVWRPLAEARHRENDIMADVAKRNTESLKAVPEAILKTFGDTVKIPEMPGPGGDITWTRMQLHQMARNYGTEQNWKKLTEGRGWDAQAAEAALMREMTGPEWEFVQRDLDTVGSFWPEIEGLYKRVNGIAPPKVAARKIVTPHGTFDGGYYPLVADRLANPQIGMKAGAADGLLSNLYTRATTRNGFVNERTEAKYVVSLAPGNSHRHVMEVVHDFTHREALMQADKFLSDTRIIRAMREAIGPEMQGQFRPWLKHIANQHAMDHTGNQAVEAIANKMRTSMSVMGMGYRISTMLQQVAGYANSIEALGSNAEMWMGSGTKSMLGMGLRDAHNFAIERSGVMRHRMMQVDQTQAQELAKLQGKTGLAADVRRFAFHGIGLMDRAVVLPTWHAGYNKGIAEGMAEGDAIAFADKVVEASQGGAGAMNTAAIQRVQGMSSLLVMFYSYGSAYYNRQAQLARDWKGAVRERKTSDLPRLMARTWWLMFAPNMVSAMIQQMLGQGPDENESYAGWLAAQSVAGVFTGLPVVGGFVKSLVSGFDFQASPLDRAGSTVLNAAKDVWHSLDDYIPAGVPLSDADGRTHASKRAVRNSVETLGYATGLPLGPAAPASQFITDWANGNAHPEGVGDWLYGLQTGKEKKH